MTYSPGSPGYPPGQQPTTQFAAPAQRFGKAPEAAPAEDGPGKLPFYLTVATAVLGLLVYLASFGPMFTVPSTDFPVGATSGTTLGLGLAVVASILAGALAGMSVLPKQKGFYAVVAAISTVAFLLVIGDVISKPGEAGIGWGLYLVIAFTLLQVATAVAALLFDAGVLSAPAPRPSYEQQPPQQYGQYGGPGSYYGQPHPGQPQHQAPQPPPPPQHQGPQHSAAPPQRSGYPSQYGGGYSSGPTTGGFPALGSHSGPPTPPTGFPTYGQPQRQQSASSAPTTQVPSQPPQQPQPPSPSSQSSQQSGPSSS
ncbi:MAG: DUF5336 domain-containing protein [Actinobacteria bacterium]|nr:DUF5336 domain-containing protein [Actinomycetota bacterium]